jgi:hypothetical protein
MFADLSDLSCELFIKYNFLVLGCIWLPACLSYDSRLVLVKLILYHVDFIIKTILQ